MAGLLDALAPYLPAFVINNPMLIVALIYVLFKYYKCGSPAAAATS
jgi:hypothetical protein